MVTQDIEFDYFDLDSAAHRVFRKEYARYTATKVQLTSMRASMLKEYRQNLDSMSDRMIQELLENILGNYINHLKLYKKTFRRLSKVLPVDKAAQFIQTEEYLDSVIHLEVLEDLPFIGEFTPQGETSQQSK